MTAPGSRVPARGVATAGRVLAGIVVVVAGMLLLVATWLVVRGRFGPADQNPHGFGLIFGALLAVVAALVAFGTLPLAVPPHRRRQVYRLSRAGVLALVALVVISVLTA